MMLSDWTIKKQMKIIANKVKVRHMVHLPWQNMCRILESKVVIAIQERDHSKCMSMVPWKLLLSSMWHWKNVRIIKKILRTRKKLNTSLLHADGGYNNLFWVQYVVIVIPSVRRQSRLNLLWHLLEGRLKLICLENKYLVMWSILLSVYRWTGIYLLSTG